MRTRLAIAALGVLAGLYGAWLFYDTGLDNIVAAAIWLGAGVVAHDFVLAPLFIGLVALARRVVHGRARPWVTAVAVVVGTVSVVAIPVLGRFGARSDNATLLPRDYLTGWLAMVVVVVAVAGVGWAVHTRMRRRESPPAP